MKRAAILSFCLMGITACASGDKKYAQGEYEGVADRDSIREIVGRRLPELQVCYEQAIDQMPGAEGKLTLDWDLVADGTVENLKVAKADKKIQGAVPCVLAKVKTWRFPRPPEGEVMAVTYPFCFSENGKICLTK